MNSIKTVMKEGKGAFNTAPLGDIRRWAVKSRGQGVDIALRAGIEITNWE